MQIMQKKKEKKINHLYNECKRNKKIWKHFQKYYKNLIQKEYTPLQHILTISVLSLPLKTKKLAAATPFSNKTN